MKRILLSVVFLLTAAFFYGEPADETLIPHLEQWMQSGFFMREGLPPSLEQTVKDLTFDDKKNLFGKYRKDAWEAFFLNVLIPGMGSRNMGDIENANIIQIGFFGGAGVCLVTWYPLLLVGLGENPNLNWLETSLCILFLGGLVSMGFCEFANLISPFDYAESYNSRLKKTLGYYPELEGVTSGFYPKSRDEFRFGSTLFCVRF